MYKVIPGALVAQTFYIVIMLNVLSVAAASSSVARSAGTATISSRTISTPNFPQNKSDILHRRFSTFLGIPTITLSYTSSNHRATSAAEAGAPVVVSSGTAIAGASNEATTTATVFGDSASTTSTTPSVEAEWVPSQIPNSKMSGKSYGGREGMELGVRLGLLFLTFLTATMLVGMII